MLSQDFIDSYAGKPVPWGFQDLGYIVFKRTYARPVYDADGVLVRHEEWHETVGRVVNGAQEIGAGLTDEEARRLFDHIYNLRGTVGGRMLWQLGTPNVDRFGAASLTNCWFTRLDTPEDFGWLFDMLMLGGGVGYSVGEPWKLGAVRQGSVTHEDGNDADYIVPDKREGWTELLVRALRAYLGDRRDPQTFTYSTHLVRPAGAPIKTFGGVASGPGILVDGIRQITKVLDGAVGRNLTATEVLDIANLVGSIVVSGNVRRSAQIALGYATDEGFLNAKRWDLGNIPNHRAMSNNTVVVGSIDELPEAFWQGYEGNGEPYGMFNVWASRTQGRTGEARYDGSVEGTNPCAEISLAHRESCNLAEVFLPNIESREQLMDVTSLLYKVQKAVAALGYNDPQSDAITRQNMRLGMGVTGVAQAMDKLAWLGDAYLNLRRLDKEWSAERGWNESVRLTTVKPSGTLSLLAGVTPGGHPGYAQFHIRRVRMAVNDPLVDYCRERGYHVEHAVGFDGSHDPNTVVVEFPCAFPDDTVLADEVSALDQLELQRALQYHWSDNAVSVTIYYRKDELDEIRDYLRQHWSSMKSVSFLLHSEHGFAQAPYEAISEGRYRELAARVHGSPVGLADGLSGGLLDDLECEGGACPVR